ncbi:MAG: acyl-CoA dehydrogenase, partial [Chloroflexi bacterium]
MSPVHSAAQALQLARELACEFSARAAAADVHAKLPAEDVAALRSAGFFALSVPRAHGGSGLTLAECLAIQIELAQGSAATAMVLGMPLHIFGSASEHCPWLPNAFEHLCQQAAAGALVNAVASEPEMGSPSRGGLPQTTLNAHTAGGYVLNGLKTWTTGGRHLTHMLVRVRHAEVAAIVLVETGRAGVEWDETWANALSLRASDSHDVRFNNVHLPAENLIQPDCTLPGAPPNAWFPVMMAAVYLGSAIAARNAVIQFALERTPTALGAPIATLPKIQRQVGALDVRLMSARTLLEAAVENWDGSAAAQRALYPRIVAAKY